MLCAEGACAMALFVVSPRRGDRTLPQDWANEIKAVGEFGEA
jgi:hypothetical protein